MRGGGRAWLALALMASALGPHPAGAQYPVCDRLAGDAVSYVGCPQGGRFRVARFLASFGIEHIFDSGVAPFRRDAKAFLDTLAPGAVADHRAVRHVLADLAPVDFTKLDTSTGMFRLDLADTRRALRWEDEAKGEHYRFSARLPQKLEGGYWRAPDVLQMAFWESKRVRVKLARDGHVELSEAIECLAITADGLRLVMAGGHPRDVLIAFAPCE